MARRFERIGRQLHARSKAAAGALVNGLLPGIGNILKPCGWLSGCPSRRTRQV